MKQMTFLDLCSGIGGFRLGLETAGHKCIGYCEYDKFARASYEAMYDTEGEWKAHDVTKLKPEDVPYADIWCFGFPCQDISVAGKQRGLVGKRSGIYYNIIDLLKGKEESAKPSYLLVENVSLSVRMNTTLRSSAISQATPCSLHSASARAWPAKTSESRRTVSVCSLSQILEAEVDEKYYLSPEKTQQLLTSL